MNRSHQLKQALIEFLLDAEGELAESLESYVAAKSGSVGNRHDVAFQQNMLIDTFATEGKVGDKTPLDLFLENHPELSQSDIELVRSWKHSFIGLFAITKVLPDGFELINWLTTKNYIVKPNNSVTLKEMARLKEGEILLTRIAPVTNSYWMFSCPYSYLGRLGKPKLAVAIGNFKDNHKDSLYSDAPELLEQAWQSVAEYHKEFHDFFGSEEVTLSGYELNKKLTELQEQMTKKRLQAMGINESKSLFEIAQEAGATEEEIKAAADSLRGEAIESGADSKAVAQLFDSSKGPTKMVMPQVELPGELKKAEQITVFTHPRWGQMFLPTYTQFKTILESDDWQTNKESNKLVKKYLEDPTINAFIWHKLARLYPKSLEKVLQTFLERPDFKIERDLNALLKEHNKPVEPELPEIASVPIHLHNLFQEAMAEVSKSKLKSKGKSKEKTAKGFK